MIINLLTTAKKDMNYKNIICIVIIICSIIYMFYHLIHCIGYGDDIYPISLCHSIINGNIPFVNSWIPYPGFVLLSPLVHLYKIINKGYTGVVYYYKCLYFVIVLLNIFIMNHIFDLKYKDSKMVNLISAILINQSIYVAWNGLSYSYIFILVNVYAALIICFYDSFKIDKTKISALSAVLMFVMSLFYPTSSILAILYSLFFYIKTKNIKYVLIYVLTGVLLIIIYIMSIFISGGSIDSILKTINEIISLPHNAWKMGIVDSIIFNIYKYSKFILLTFMIVFIVIIIGNIYPKINGKEISNEPNYCLALLILFSIVFYISSIQQNYILTVIMVQPLLLLYIIIQIYENVSSIKKVLYALLLVFPFYTIIVAPSLFVSMVPFNQTKKIDYGILKIYILMMKIIVL